MSRAPRQRARDQPVRALGGAGHDDRRLRIIAQIVAAQAGDDGGHLLLEPRHVTRAGRDAR
jgi:hypothetical protein